MHQNKSSPDRGNSCLKCKLGAGENGLCKFCVLENLGTPTFKLLKQREVSKYIQNSLSRLGITELYFNKYVAGFYPDIRFQIDQTNVIIEIDENQHKGGVAYSEEREKKRLGTFKNEFQSLILLRINPDKYKGRGGMFSFKEDVYAGTREITFNTGEIEFRCEQIDIYLQWILVLILNKFNTFLEIRLFFD